MYQKFMLCERAAWIELGNLTVVAGDCDNTRPRTSTQCPCYSLALSWSLQVQPDQEPNCLSVEEHQRVSHGW